MTVVAATALLAGCAARPAAVATARLPASDQHAPDYARRPFEAFSRVNAVAIASREWRAFGSAVNDDPPDLAPLPLALRPDRQPGLWQRVGDYWWFGQDRGTREGGWSGRYDEFGLPYLGEPAAWSAAFMSYVMRAAGAGNGFPYTPLHADYINAAARGEGVLRVERPSVYPPRPGDLICLGRRNARGLRFDDLPTSRFFGHCDMVAQALPGQLVVIGGNVAGGVTMKHVPVTAAGTLAEADGTVLDARYPWFVVVRVLYAAD